MDTKIAAATYWDELHEFLTDFPDAWHLRAEQLIAAFETLIAKPTSQLGLSLLPPASMLAGFAVECLLKGVLVFEGKAFNEKNEFTRGTHRLREFAEDIGMPIDAARSEVLQRLEQYIAWGGRYPVPLRPQQLRPKLDGGGDLMPISGTWQGDDWDAIRQIIKELKARLPPLPELAQM